jgi:hypothetical protein
MTGSDEDRGRSRRLGAEDQRWSSTGRVLGGLMIEKSGDAVCGLKKNFIRLSFTPPLVTSLGPSHHKGKDVHSVQVSAYHEPNQN